MQRIGIFKGLHDAGQHEPGIREIVLTGLFETIKAVDYDGAVGCGYGTADRKPDDIASQRATKAAE